MNLRSFSHSGRWWLVAFVGWWVLIADARAVTVVINGAQTNQVIDGFGANVNSWPWSTNEIQPQIDALIDEAGLSIFRVVLQNGWESVNDNDDPAVMNWDYYNTLYSTPPFERLWAMLAYLNQKGITNGVMLNPQGIGPEWMGGTLLSAGNEEEWAEMVASLLIYARTNRHIAFTLVAPHNEPDYNPQGILFPTAAQYVATLHKLAEKLDANGLGDVRFVGPDRSGGDTTFMPEMMADALVMSKVAHFGVHSYSAAGSGTVGVPAFINQAGYPDRTLWVTEFNVWCASCIGQSGTNSWDYALGTASYLFDHLAANASAGLVWEGYDSFYPHDNFWDFFGLIRVDSTNAAPMTFTRTKGFYTMAQVAKFVRPGAQRFTISGDAESLQLLAYIHKADGQVTVTGINPSSATTLTATLTSVPELAEVKVYYTSSTTNLAEGGTVPVSNGTFTVNVPEDCVFTIVGAGAATTVVTVALTAPDDNRQVNGPLDVTLQATASTTAGTLTAVEFFNGATKLGARFAPPFAMTWSNVSPGSFTFTARASNSLGDFAVSTPVHLTVAGPVAELLLTPSNATVVPYGSQQFSAVARDALGTTLNPQPGIDWTVDGGGIISTGRFLSSGMVGGPFSVTATIGLISNTATINVRSNSNVAPLGIGYTWNGLITDTQDAPRVAASGVNDEDLDTDVRLVPGPDMDSPNRFEAAGVLWATPQTIDRVVYRNGSFGVDENGVFAAGFRLQWTTNGSEWQDADTGWNLTPAYSYNSPDAAFVDYTFTGPLTTVLGVRALGQVRTSETSPPPNSWVAHVTEVQAFAAGLVPPTLRATKESGGVGIWWPSAATGFGLEATASLSAPVTWSTVTNAPQLIGSEWQVLVPPDEGQRFFRLRQ